MNRKEGETHAYGAYAERSMPIELTGSSKGDCLDVGANQWHPKASAHFLSS